MKATIVIGKNFGDEGKGLAVDYFASRSVQAGESAVCVRHNGGAQAGHTVDFPDRRFVFSQLSSASFRGISTYWADSFLPDLFKLTDEAESFRQLSGRIPQIFASPDCRCTCILDVLVNMLLETRRGKNRHGSCGMGINEAVVRSETFPLRLGDAAGQSAETLYQKLRFLQREYLPLRLAELQVSLENGGEYGEMLKSDDVLRGAAEAMCRGASLVQIRPQETLREYDRLLFEGAQGLLLDAEYLKFAPHLTSSRTGLTEPARILRSLAGDAALPETEIVYITRSYVTRHGAGPLPHERPENPYDYGKDDKTNVSNPWQGTLRSAPHGSAEEFTEAVRADLAAAEYPASVSLFVTHLHQFGGCLRTAEGDFPPEEYLRRNGLSSLFGRLYLSDSPFSAEVRIK